MTVYTAGIPLKKQFGQHFLRQQSVIDEMIAAVDLNERSSVFEIGCGDGFLTRSILKQDIARLWVFEIDSQWAEYVQKTYPDERMSMFRDNILDVDFSRFEPHKPWILLANLPYLITFPILHLLQRNRDLLQEGVIMIQEEVAQKLVKKSGRGYGYPSLFFQHYFELKLLQKISPGAFLPPPKVYSRLVHFKPKTIMTPIPDEEHFWKFIKLCFHQPRRTLKNNLAQSQIDLSKIPEKYILLRAQQMNMEDLLHIWELARS
jgi:16S rRNA (adenine1518-N6/adenine1519-N6)-dimethyltransferase